MTPPTARTAWGPGPAPLVLWLASEAQPWASTGGLADVTGSLPAVLRRLGWDVRLCLPQYSSTPEGMLGQTLGPPLVDQMFPAEKGSRVRVCPVEGPPGDVPTYLVQCAALFERKGLYGDVSGTAYEDNPRRFVIFQLAARALAAALVPAPAILHCHDWHSALLPALLQFPGERPVALAQTRTIVTIHNLQFQGEAERNAFQGLGLPRDLWHPEWAEHFDHYNSLKAGILWADRVTTVSPTYAAEVRTPSRGMGLDGPLRERGTEFRGILNGIDVETFNPETDPSLAAPFSAGHLAERSRCKTALRTELGLAGTAADPIVAYVGRLTPEKGLDLLIEAIPSILDYGAKMVVLGTGDPHIEAALRRREQEFPDRFRVLFQFNQRLARRVYAGADVLVVPSRSEPCGLVQLYALRYGAVPVVHAVGGLRDTIRDGETGFLFHEATARAVGAGVRRALDAFKDPGRWRHLQENALRQDWSWTTSAGEYEALYRELLLAPPRQRPLPAIVEPLSSGLPVDFGPDLPGRLPSDAFRLMVQDARTLFVYWQTTHPGPLELLIEERPTGLLMPVAGDRGAVGDAWCAALPEHAYRAILRSGGAVVARSNPVLTPRDGPVAPGEETPAWLSKALASGLFHSDADKPLWDQLFMGDAESGGGTRRRDGQAAGDLRGWPHSAAWAGGERSGGGGT